MVIYALDASALLRFIDKETGTEQVRPILEGLLSGEHRVLVCALHWGEVAGNLYRKKGLEVQRQVMERFSYLGLEFIPATPDRAIRAAILKAELRIPYGDAFGIELAESVPCTFVTADHDLKPAANRAEILFLPKK
ncbi:MAG: PIN domain-containing protein [Acidobacteriaceae bacterium]